MKFYLRSTEVKEITDFEKEIGCELEIREREVGLAHKQGLPRFYASFENADIKDNSVLIGMYGDGMTVDECLSNYCKMISNRILVIDAVTPLKRREIKLPQLKHTKRIKT